MFKKYPSITNHYHNKDINRFLQIHGDNLDDCMWNVTEKLHGANISFLVNVKDLDVKVFSRNNEITNSNFYNADSVINEFIDRIKNNITDSVMDFSEIEPFRLFGELFGSNVQKGVDYGQDKRINIFDAMIDDTFISQTSCKRLLHLLQLSDYFVPELAIYDKLSDAMEHNEIFNSKIPNKEPECINEAEGIVIKPYNKVLIDQNGSLFYIKKKNPKFAEKNKVKKPKNKTVYSTEVENYKNEFLSYINDNRMQSVFSKEGEIQSHKEIGKYIPKVLLDAQDDFMKDNEIDLDNFTKEERKYIFNASKEIVELLKKYL